MKLTNHIKRNILKCLLCNSIIESFHVHDFKYCACKEAFIDGGREYVRLGANSFDNIEVLTEYYTEAEWAKIQEYKQTTEYKDKLAAANLYTIREILKRMADDEEFQVPKAH